MKERVFVFDDQVIEYEEFLELPGEIQETETVGGAEDDSSKNE